MNARPLAYASFSIYQDVEPPEFWTDYFGVSPSTTGVKGQPPLTKSGRESAFPWRQGYWSVSSKGVVFSDYLSPHLRYLVSLLALPRVHLRAQIERQHAKVRFFCYWNNADGNRVPDVPSDIQRMADATGIEIDIDEYR